MSRDTRSSEEKLYDELETVKKENEDLKAQLKLAYDHEYRLKRMITEELAKFRATVRKYTDEDVAA